MQWDWRDKKNRTRIILGVVLVFLVSAGFSWKEIKYAVWGKTIETKVEQFAIIKNTDTNETEELTSAEVYFHDGRPLRHEWLSVPAKWNTPKKWDERWNPNQDGKKDVIVQYVPGDEGTARILGDSSMVWVWIMGVVFVLGALVIWRVARAT